MENSQFEINSEYASLESYLVIKFLEQSIYTKVKKAFKDANYYAIKIMIRQTTQFINEAQMLKKINSQHPSHPNIIKFIEGPKIGKYLKKNGLTYQCIYSVLEFADEGDIFYYVADVREQQKGYPMPIVNFYFRQMIQGLKCLHINNICHRDIKPENFLLDKNFNLKLSDFGFAIEITNNQKLTENLGSEMFKAPEINNNEEYDGKQIDIFALGVTLFFIAFGQHPFTKAVKEDKAFKTLQEAPQLYWRDFFIKLNLQAERIPESFLTLLQDMLSESPDQRPTIQEIEESEWYNSKIASNKEVAFNQLWRKQQRTLKNLQKQIEQEMLKSFVEQLNQDKQKQISLFGTEEMTETGETSHEEHILKANLSQDSLAMEQLSYILSEVKLMDYENKQNNNNFYSYDKYLMSSFQMRKQKKHQADQITDFYSQIHSNELFQNVIEILNLKTNSIKIHRNNYKILSELKAEEQKLELQIEVTKGDDHANYLEFKKLSGEKSLFIQIVTEIKQQLLKPLRTSCYKLK